MVKLNEIISQFEQFAPKWMAEDGDPIGLQFGYLNQNISKLMITLDVRPSTVDEAIKNHVDLIFSHHPALFHPIKQPMDLSFPQNNMYSNILKNNIAVYSAHTNLDSADGGMNDWLCDIFNVKNRIPLLPIHEEKMYKLAVFTQSNTADSMRKALEIAGAGDLVDYKDCSFSFSGTTRFIPIDEEHSYTKNDKNKMSEMVQEKIEVIFPKRIKNNVLKAMFDNHPQKDFIYDLYPIEGLGRKYSMGRVGDLPNDITIKDFANKCCDLFDIPGVRIISKKIDKKINRIAILAGSGARFYKNALDKKADLYITGDVSYHLAHDILESGISVIDVGHYIEYICKAHLTKMFNVWNDQNNWNIDIYESKVNTDPYHFIMTKDQA